MSDKKKDLVQELIALLPEAEKAVYQEIAASLADLGYRPQKQKAPDFQLCFRHAVTGKVIAKMGIRQQKGFVSIKFFACREVPPQYAAALSAEIHAQHGRHCVPLPTPEWTNQCGPCRACTGGGLAYYYQYPDGRAVLRCGAYPIPIPQLTLGDVAELKRLLNEQHHYFLSIG